MLVIHAQKQSRSLVFAKIKHLQGFVETLLTYGLVDNLVGGNCFANPTLVLSHAILMLDLEAAVRVHAYALGRLILSRLAVAEKERLPSSMRERAV